MVESQGVPTPTVNQFALVVFQVAPADPVQVSTWAWANSPASPNAKINPRTTKLLRLQFMCLLLITKLPMKIR